MDANQLKGVFSPIVTVFDETGNIRLQDMIGNILRYNETPLSGYMPLGSNGEFMSLTDDEAFLVLDTVGEHKLPEKVMVGGCGRESAYKTIRFIKAAALHGLDYAFLLPPHYFLSRMDDEALLRYYLEVAEHSPIPLVVYNAPKFAAGLTISPQVMHQLAAHDNIAAIKNSSMVHNRPYMQAVAGLGTQVLAGNILSFFDGLAEGAAGAVLSTACYLPEACCEIYHLFQKGKTGAARTLHARLTSLSAASVGPMGVAGVKCAMMLRGYCGGHVRNPLRDATEDERALIMRCLSQNELF
ncbi:MAG TPA: dihydrodipicolinate synthase family protein [Clostridia bacterium]|nr:dihydrodipicolinate synthase family protein [Clostridia bacterium]